METSTKQTISHTANAYLDQHNISQVDLAAKAGIRKEHLGNILKGVFTYDAGDKTGNIPTKHFKKLAEFVGYSTDKVYWENKPTPQFTKAIAVLKEAKEFGYTRILVGDTGWGKTHAIKLFANKNPTDVFVVTVGSSDNLSDLIDKMIDCLRITTGKTKSKKIRQIAERLKDLRNNGFEPQVIFDEAEYMKQPALCAMKELYDALNKYCSIILIGTHQLIQNIDRLRKRNKNGIPQFYRRIKFGIRILPSLDRSFKPFLNGIEDRELIKWLKSNCDNYGELHDVLVPCLREADRLNQTISLQLVKQVLNIG